jgi:hypothetical protein
LVQELLLRQTNVVAMFVISPVAVHRTEFPDPQLSRNMPEHKYATRGNCAGMSPMTIT